MQTTTLAIIARSLRNIVLQNGQKRANEKYPFMPDSVISGHR